MATVKKLPTGAYRLRWEETARDDRGAALRDDDGRLVKRSRSETYQSKKRADARKRELEEALATTGRTPDRAAGEASFAEYAASWLAIAETRVRTGKLKASTADGYARELARDVYPVFGARPVASITPQEATEFHAALLRRVAPGTAKHSYSVFRRVLAHAASLGAIRENPATSSTWDGTGEGAAEYKFEGTALTREQVAAVAGHVGERYPVYALAVRFLASTGLRAGEFAGLDVGDVRLVPRNGGMRGSVSVVRTRERKGGGWIEGTPKTRRSRRTVPLPSGLARELRAYLDDVHPGGDDPSAPLFPSRKVGGSRAKGKTKPVPYNWSSPVNPGPFYEGVLKPAFRAAGLPVTDSTEGTRGVRLHDLRHTFATLQLMAGVPIEQVSAWLGHSNSVITSTIYAHWIQSDDETNALDFSPAASAEQARTIAGNRPSDDNVVALRPAR